MRHALFRTLSVHGSTVHYVFRLACQYMLRLRRYDHGYSIRFAGVYRNKGHFEPFFLKKVTGIG